MKSDMHPWKNMMLASLLWLCAMATAQAAGTVINLSGPLLAKKVDGTVKILSVRSEVQAGDTLVSENGTYARIKFLDKSEVTMRPNTHFKIDQFAYDEAKPEQDSALFSLIKGGLRAISGTLGKRSYDKVSFATPSATVGIRGTTFVMEYVEPHTSAMARVQAKYLQMAALGNSVNFDHAVVSDSPPALYASPFTLQLAQNAPGQGGGLAPGLYVHVIDGLIQLSNRGGVQQFAAGQFGFTGSVVQPPVIVPNNPGIQFNPPPAFQSSTGPQSNSGSNSKPKTVDCEVR